MMIICMRERKVKVKSGKKDLCFNALLAGLLSTIEVVGINPFGMGFMAALVIERELSLLGFLMFILGMGYHQGIFMVCLQSIIMLGFFFLYEGIKGRQSKAYFLLSFLTLFIQIMAKMITGTEKISVTKILFGTILTSVCCIMFKESLEGRRKEKNLLEMGARELTGNLILLSCVLGALPGKVGEIYILTSVGFYLLLVFGYRYGVREGALIGAVCGMVVSYRYGEIGLLGAFVLLAIAAGIGRELKKSGSILATMAAFILLGIYYDESIFQVGMIRGAFSGVIVFLFTPKAWIEKIDYDGFQVDNVITNEMNRMQQIRMEELAEGFLALGKSISVKQKRRNRLKQQEFVSVMEEVSGGLCASCENYTECWSENSFDTYRAGYSILGALEENGDLKEEDIPKDFMEQCQHLDYFIMETNRNYETAKRDLWWKNRMLEGQEAIAAEITKVGQMMEEIGSTMYVPMKQKRGLERKVVQALKKEGISIRKIMIAEKKGRKELYFEGKTLFDGIIMTKDIKKLLSKVMNVPMKESNYTNRMITKEYQLFRFCQDANYYYLRGIAKKTKEGEGISGDNFSIVDSENGKTYLLLSDGMGSGLEASLESGKVIEVMERLLEAGFYVPSALGLMNCLAGVGNKEDMFTTLDFCEIDLFTGMISIIKAGAASTFIKRENMVELIQSTNFPLGVMEENELEQVEKKLYDGDMLIFISDGITDCIEEDKENWMKDTILKIKSKNPQEMADELMEQVLEQGKQKVRDDMTILVVGIWKK